MSMQSPDERIVVTVDADLEDIVPGFLQHRKEDVDKIREAMAQNDYDIIRVLGHTMKGTGGGYGFDAITDMGRSLEDAAKERNMEIIKQSANDLSSYLDHIEVVYE